MVTNIRSSIFYTQHMRLNEIYDPRKPVHSSVINRGASKYLIQKWREYVESYASERGITISSLVAHKVARKIANRNLGENPLRFMKLALLAEIEDALS